MKASRLLTLALFAASVASAGVIFSTGNIPQTDSAVLFNCPTICSAGPAPIGHLQQVVPDTAVDFTSEEGLAVIGACPGSNALSGANYTTGFDDLQITVPGHTFTSIILQLTSLASATGGTVTFVAHLSGEPNVTSTAFFDSHTGGNYFTITTTGVETLTELDFTTTQFQDNVSQVRIGGVSGVTIVPEPATYGMVGFALVGLGLLRRRLSR